ASHSASKTLSLHDALPISLYSNTKGKIKDLTLPEDDIEAIRSYKGIFYALTSSVIYRIGNNGVEKIGAGSGLQAFAFRNKEIILGTKEGYYGIDLHSGDTSLSMQRKVPIQNVGHLMIVDGKLWAGTDKGAF